MITARSNVLRSTFYVLCSVLLLGILLQPALSWAASADEACLKIYREKQYLKAGECFESVVRALGATASLSQSQRHYKGRMLRNAAIAYRKHANQLTPQQGAKWRLRALSLLDTYLKEDLCETPERCRLTKGLSESIKNEVGYAPLMILSGHPQANVELVGSDYRKTGVGSEIRWQVPPGSYLVNVKIPGQPASSKNIVVLPSTALAVSFVKQNLTRQPPPPPPTSNTGPWVVFGVGLAVSVAGGVLLVVGQIQEDGIHRNAADFQPPSTASADDTTGLLERHAANRPMFIAGWTGVGVGLATTISGIIWLTAKK